ncbi:TPA: fimbrial protein [Enterobacter ludwigii]
MKKIFLLSVLTLLAGAVASQSVMAASSGVINVTATFYANTCALSGNNITHDLGPFSMNDAWAGQSWGVFKTMYDAIHVSGCPASVTQVIMTPSFAVTGSEDTRIANSGDAGGVTATLQKDDSNPYATGTKYTFPVGVDGSATIPMTQVYSRHASDSVSAGNMSFIATFAFEYQ